MSHANQLPLNVTVSRCDEVIYTYEGSKAKYTTVGNDLEAAQTVLAQLNATRTMETAQT